MKIFCIGLISILFSICIKTYGQDGGNHPEISSIAIAVVMPMDLKDIKDFDEAQVDVLRNRIKNIVSMNGLSAQGGVDGFVMYPEFDILGVDEAPTPIRNITIVRCGLSLFIRQFIPNGTSNIEFPSLYIDISGSGYSKKDAISNALTKIRPGDSKFQDFLANTRETIIKYYKQNCDKVIAEATNAASLEKYSKSFALLLSIPKEATDCYAQVQKKTVEIYLKKQKQDCKQLLLIAKTYATKGDFDRALDTLRHIDPESICKEEIWTLMNEIETKVDAAEKQRLQLIREQMHNDAEIEKTRLAAIAEIGGAYMEGAGKRNYVIKGKGSKAMIESDQADTKDNMGNSLIDGLKTKPSGAKTPANLVEATTLKSHILFENNIFPSYILSGGVYNDIDDQKKFGYINSCIGISLINPVASGTLKFEIYPVENKFFEKVSGSLDFIQNEEKIYFPDIPWKFDELRGIQQSTQLSIKYKLTDKAGNVKEQTVKVNVHSIRECITSFVFNGKNKETKLLAAYVNEENPYIEKLLKEGIDKNWVSRWTGYQLGPEELEKQIKAIWKILSSKGIHYSDITGATTNTTHTFTSQTVRPFCESISNKQANCVEGTVVFASILKKIDVRPVFVLVPGHCFLAYHKTGGDINDYNFLETTLLGEIKGKPTEDAFEDSYLAAVQAGVDKFKAAGSNFFMIDVQSARQQNVLPINLSDETCK